jgi:hypothetical protein
MGEHPISRAPHDMDDGGMKVHYVSLEPCKRLGKISRLITAFAFGLAAKTPATVVGDPVPGKDDLRSGLTRGRGSRVGRRSWERFKRFPPSSCSEIWSHS